MATAFIVDPALKTRAGHHWNAATGWADAAHLCGLDLLILAHPDIGLQAIDTYAMDTPFTGVWYGYNLPDPRTAQRQLRKAQSRFRDELQQSLVDVGPADVIVLVHATLVTFNGLAAWAAAVAADRRPRLVVWPLLAPNQDEFAEALGSSAPFVAAVDRLRGLFGDGFSIVAETEVVRQGYRALGFPSKLMPYAALRRPLPAAKRRKAGEPPTIGVTGAFWWYKGLKHLLDVIERVSDRHGDVRWLIAGGTDGRSSPELDAIANELSRRDNIELVFGPFDSTEFDRHMGAIDLHLLPYDPDHYATRGSGIAGEAEMMGAPYVAPAVAFSAPAAEAGAAMTFDAWTAEAIAAALETALADLPAMTTRAGALAETRAAEIAATRADLFGQLFGEIERSPPRPPEPWPRLPAVDIVVTHRNYRQFLRECLESVTRQTYPHWRCVVVDDCSNDISFGELRTLVASFGERFTLERHVVCDGQVGAVATGLSLGSAPFVIMLDADDCLTDDALDRHLAWHLNRHAPVALTSGRLLQVDRAGALLAGTLEWLQPWDPEPFIHPLPTDAAFRRDGARSQPVAAKYIDSSGSQLEMWYWSPTSSLMFRRTMMELVLPDTFDISRLAADTYFCTAAHQLGSSIVIDEPVALYRRHGGNHYSNTSIFGAGTLRSPEVDVPVWRMAKVLADRLHANRPEFDAALHQTVINGFLTRAAPFVARSIAEVAAAPIAPVAPTPVAGLRSSDLQRQGLDQHLQALEAAHAYLLGGSPDRPTRLQYLRRLSRSLRNRSVAAAMIAPPPGLALGATTDPELAHRVGATREAIDYVLASRARWPLSRYWLRLNRALRGRTAPRR